MDSIWHPMDKELPSRTTDVELQKKDGSIIQAQIVVEPSGFYIYLNPGWGNINDYTHWKIRTDNLIE